MDIRKITLIAKAKRLFKCVSNPSISSIVGSTVNNIRAVVNFIRLSGVQKTGLSVDRYFQQVYKRGIK